MKHYPYIIVGGGLTADAAVRGIRQIDPQSPIGLFSVEPDPPYKRPYLSKNLWKDTPLEKVWLNTQELGVDMHLGCRVVGLDPAGKMISTDSGEQYTYDKLLLATGGKPVELPFGNDHIVYYRTFADYQRLRAMSANGEHFLVIGGGFIGSEIAAALVMNGKKVTIIFPEKNIGSKVFPANLAYFLNVKYLQKAVQVVPGDTVTGLHSTAEGFEIQTRGGLSILADGVVAGIGIRPNVDLAQLAGIDVDNGIVVDKNLHTSAAHIFAAGDVANFFYSALGKRTRVEHEDNAIQMGRLAGRNMAGANEPYDHIPMFYSDLFELGYEAVGELSTKHQIVADWKESFKEGIVYYLEGDRLRGVLLWNVWDRVPEARTLLSAPGPFKPSEIKHWRLDN